MFYLMISVKSTFAVVVRHVDSSELFSTCCWIDPKCPGPFTSLANSQRIDVLLKTAVDCSLVKKRVLPLEMGGISGVCWGTQQFETYLFLRMVFSTPVKRFAWLQNCHGSVKADFICDLSRPIAGHTPQGLWLGDSSRNSTNISIYGMFCPMMSMSKHGCVLFSNRINRSDNHQVHPSSTCCLTTIVAMICRSVGDKSWWMWPMKHFLLYLRCWIQMGEM